jgi:hypothetical protein
MSDGKNFDVHRVRQYCQNVNVLQNILSYKPNMSPIDSQGVIVLPTPDPNLTVQNYSRKEERTTSSGAETRCLK